MKLDRYRRKAAAKVFYFVSQQVHYASFSLGFNHMEHEWGGDTLFTEKEQAYVKQLKTRLHELSHLCLQFAWRLDGKGPTGGPKR